MIARFRLSWMRLCGVIAVALVIFASLMLPTKLEHMRTGHWFTEHFLGYFAASLVVCLGWRRPFVVGAGLAVTAFVLEALQALTPNHSPTLAFGNRRSERSGSGGWTFQADHGGAE